MVSFQSPIFREARACETGSAQRLITVSADLGLVPATSYSLQVSNSLLNFRKAAENS